MITTGHQMPYTERKACLNCGRPIPKKRVAKSPKIKFCDKRCHDRWWSRPQRHLSKITELIEDHETRLKKLDKVIEITSDLGRITVDLAQFIAGLDKRIKTLEGVISIKK